MNIPDNVEDFIFPPEPNLYVRTIYGGGKRLEILRIPDYETPEIIQETQSCNATCPTCQQHITAYPEWKISAKPNQQTNPKSGNHIVSSSYHDHVPIEGVLKHPNQQTNPKSGNHIVSSSHHDHLPIESDLKPRIQQSNLQSQKPCYDHGAASSQKTSPPVAPRQTTTMTARAKLKTMYPDLFNHLDQPVLATINHHQTALGIANILAHVRIQTVAVLNPMAQASVVRHHIGNILASANTSTATQIGYKPIPHYMVSRPHISHYHAIPKADSRYVTAADYQHVLHWLIDHYDWIFIVTNGAVSTTPLHDWSINAIPANVQVEDKPSSTIQPQSTTANQATTIPTTTIPTWARGATQNPWSWLYAANQVTKAITNQRVAA